MFKLLTSKSFQMASHVSYGFSSGVIVVALVLKVHGSVAEKVLLPYGVLSMPAAVVLALTGRWVKTKEQAN